MGAAVGNIYVSNLTPRIRESVLHINNDLGIHILTKPAVKLQKGFQQKFVVPQLGGLFGQTQLCVSATRLSCGDSSSDSPQKNSLLAAR